MEVCKLDIIKKGRGILCSLLITLYKVNHVYKLHKGDEVKKADFFKQYFAIVKDPLVAFPR